MRLRGAGAATVAAVIACGFLLSTPTPARAEPDGDGLRWETDAKFVLEPDDKIVDVSMDITLTNEIPDEGQSYYYFHQIAIPLPAEARDVVAKLDGSALDTDVDSSEDPLWDKLTVHLSPVLRYQHTQKIALTFELPDLPPRSRGLTRANPAYGTFLAYAYGDPGLVDLEVRVPDRYETENSGMVMQPGGSGRYDVFTATNIDDPLSSWAAFVARDDGKLKKQELSIDGHQIVVRSWPGDDHWAKFVKKNLTKGLPALTELIGQELPVDSLEVIESSTPHVYGYGGLYDSDTDIIEISDQLDAQLVLHELSHAWFNEAMSSEVWLNEGLATAYAVLAVEEIGGSATSEIKKVSTDDPGAQPLLTWAHRNMLTVEDAEREQYGYAASSWLVQELVDEVGLDGMAEMFSAISNHRLSYPGDTDPNAWSGRTDWRRVLDLLQERSGSGDAVELFETFVLRKEDEALLADRKEARNRYTKTVKLGDGWSAPHGLREAMSRWQFEKAVEIDNTARDVLEIRDDVLNKLEPIGVTALPGLETTYEKAESLSSVSERAEDYADVATDLADAADQTSDNPLSQVAGFALNLDGRIADAANTLADGDLEDAVETTESIASDVSNRYLIGGIVLAELLLCLGAAMRIRSARRSRRSRGRHGRRRQRGPAASSISNTSGMPSWSESTDSSSSMRR